MRYLVTGATGFIGGRVAAKLRELGHEVVALVRSPERARDLAAAGVTLKTGDIREPEGLRAAMAGADGVFHLAAWYKIGARDRSQAEAINVVGTRNVLEAMRDVGVAKGVYTSTVAIFSDTHGRMVDEAYRYDGPHLSEYDRTKWKAHYEVAEPLARAGLPLVIVQPGVVYGPGDTSSVGEAFRLYLKGRLPMIPKGSAYCWAHVDDVADGHLLAMEKGRAGESYVLAGPGHSLVEAFEVAARVTGRKAPRIRMGPAFFRGMAALTAPLAAVFPLPETYHPESLRVAASATYLASNEKSRRELGYSPRPLEEGLRDTLLPLMGQMGLKPRP